MKSPENSLPFGKRNYLLLVAALVVIVVGFALMSMDSFVDATRFSLSLYVAPVLILGGFGLVAYALLARTADNNGADKA